MPLVFLLPKPSVAEFAGLQKWKEYQKAETLDVFYNNRTVGTLYHNQMVNDSLKAIENGIHLSVVQDLQGMSVDLTEKRSYDSLGNLFQASSVIKSISGTNSWVLQKGPKSWGLVINVGGVETKTNTALVQENLSAMDAIYAEISNQSCQQGKVYADTAFDLVTEKTVVTRYKIASVDYKRKLYTLEMRDNILNRDQYWVLDSNGNTVVQDIEGLFVAKKRESHTDATIGTVRDKIDFTEMFSARVARGPEKNDRIVVALSDGLLLDSSVMTFFGQGKKSYWVRGLPWNDGHDTSETFDTTLLKYIVPTTTMQSTYPAITDLSKKIVSSLKGQFAMVDACNKYVYKTLAKRNTATFSSAVETLNAGFGDCGEHSVLCAALLRAAHIPARVVLGLVYFAPKKAFVGHAWVLAYVNNQPLLCDPAFGLFPVSNDRIPLVMDDDGTNAAKLIKFIGCMKIKYEKNRSTDN